MSFIFLFPAINDQENQRNYRNDRYNNNYNDIICFKVNITAFLRFLLA